MSSDKEERISLRAYRIWEEQGRPEGSAAEHWEQAKREIEAEDEAEAEPRQQPGDPVTPTFPPQAGTRRRAGGLA